MTARKQRGHGLTRRGGGVRQQHRGSNPSGVPLRTFNWMVRIYIEIATIGTTLVTSSDPAMWSQEILLKVGLIKLLYSIIEQLLVNPTLGDDILARQRMEQ